MAGLDDPDPRELSDRHELERLLDEAGPGVGARDRWEPGHVTASGIVLADEGVLLVFHPRLGAWLQPGGHMEPGDADIEETARRELSEEVGLTDLEPLGLAGLSIHCVPASSAEPAHLHYDVRFAYRLQAGTPRAGDGIAGWRWLPLGALSTWPTDDSVGRAVKRAVRLGAAAGSAIGPAVLRGASLADPPEE